MIEMVLPATQICGLRLMDEVKKISNDLSNCFKNLAGVKAELLLLNEDQEVSEKFPRLQRVQSIQRLLKANLTSHAPLKPTGF